MKKLFLIINVICVMFFSTYAGEKTITDTKNEFGGITESVTINPSEKEYKQYTKVLFFYDTHKKLKKTMYYFSPAVEKETGFITQEEFYNNDKISEYKMTFSKNGQEQYGVEYIVEKLNAQGETSEMWYSNGKGIAKTKANSFLMNYPIYSLNFLKKELDLDHALKGELTLDARYNIARSFVKFNGDIVDVNNEDKRITRDFMKFLNSPNMADLYTKKTTVVSEGVTYTVYLQTKITKYIKKNMEALMAYGVMGVDGKLVLFITEFDEVE